RDSYSDAKYEIAHPEENKNAPSSDSNTRPNTMHESSNAAKPTRPVIQGQGHQTNNTNNFAQPEVKNNQSQPSMTNPYYVPPAHVIGNQQYYYYA
ncbi:7560_t:CDS:1, partial [Acaulospora morrowiae]